MSTTAYETSGGSDKGSDEATTTEFTVTGDGTSTSTGSDTLQVCTSIATMATVWMFSALIN